MLPTRENDLAERDEEQEKLQRVLSALGISEEDVKAVTVLLVATAHQRKQHLAGKSGNIEAFVEPLPTYPHVLHLLQKMDHLDSQLERVEERLDQVLAALARK